MKVLADVAGHGFELSPWGLLWPLVGPCVLVLVVPVVVGQPLARLTDKLMGGEQGPPGRSADSGDEASSRPETR
jgi:hypothetical protein